MNGGRTGHHGRDVPRLPEPAPVRVDSARIIAAGIALSAVALVVVVAVPALHQGDRSWWPWTCVVAVVGGALAWLYVRRGRGNASAA